MVEIQPGSVAEWFSAFGTIAAVAVSLRLAWRGRQDSKKAEMERHNGAIDFAVEMLGPARRQSGRALELNARLDEVIDDPNTGKIGAQEYTDLAGIAGREIDTEMGKWREGIANQSTIYEGFYRTFRTSDPKLAKALAAVRDHLRGVDDLMPGLGAAYVERTKELVAKVEALRLQ